MRFLLILIVSFVFFRPAFADNVFHPEALETLNDGKAWVETSFKRGETGATTVFRIWFPHPSKEVWPVLIDTNNWKKVHSDYSDSRTLDANQFKMVAEKKPNQVNAFYELVGKEEFPSEYNRRPGREWVSYVFQRFNFPWPLSDRWVVMRVKNDENEASRGHFRYEYKSIAGNFRELKGYWELLPVPEKPGWTEFRGEYRSDPGIQVPQFLAKTIFRASMRRGAEENRRVIEARKEKNR